MAHLAFFGTPDFAVPALEAIHATAHRIALVVCPPDRAGRRNKGVPFPVKARALSLGIEVAQPSTLDPATPDGARFLEHFSTLDLDLAIVVAYGPALPPAVLSVPRRGFLMVHPSLLPRLRGAAPIERAIMEGHQETGVSLLEVAAERLTGDVYASERAAILPEDTGGSLTERLSRLGRDLLLQHLDGILEGRLPRRPQTAEGTSTAPEIAKEEAVIDWSRSAQETCDLARALDPRLPARTMLDGELVHLFRPRVVDIDIGAASPGDLLAAGDALVYATAAGAVAFAEIQAPNRRRMRVGEFLCAARPRPHAEIAPLLDSSIQRRSRLVSAALRHIRDAERLAEPGERRSLDQAFHLMGFGPECARNACLAEAWAEKAIGHGFSPAAEDNLELVLSLDAHAQRYLPASWRVRHPVLERWDVTCRYGATGSHEAALVGAAVQAARNVVDEIVLKLWTDGMLHLGGLR